MNKDYRQLITYIINDESINRPDRFEDCYRSITHGLCNIGVNKFNAIMGRKINYDDYIISDRDLYKYSPGQIGCLLSHLTLIKHFYDNIDDDIILICEDDAYIDNSSNQNIFQVIDNIPKHWYTLMLSQITPPAIFDKIM